MTKFHKEIWSRFTTALNDYNLVEDGNKIALGKRNNRTCQIRQVRF